MSSKSKVIFLGAGDIWFCTGSRTLFRQFLKELDLHFNLECLFFQFRMEGMPDADENGMIDVPDFPAKVFTPVSNQAFGLLPRKIFRIVERIVLWVYLNRWMRTIKPDDALILHGNLGLIHTLFHKIPTKKKWWFKVGIIEEEEDSGIKYRLRKALELLNATRLGKRLIVSRPMGEFLNHEYGVSDAGDFIMPCLVDLDFFSWTEEKRKTARERLGVGDRFVLLYLGSAEPQQSPAETVEFFKRLKKHRPDAFFWIASGDQEYFKTLAEGIAPEDIRIEKLPYEKLPELLPAADLGCLMRQRGIVNRVSSPVKFPEYMANGIPVIIGPESGEYTNVVQTNKVGAVADPDDAETWDDSIKTFFDLYNTDDTNSTDLRKRCFETAARLSWQHYRPSIKKEFS